MPFRIQRVPSAQPAVALAARAIAIILALVVAGLVLAASGANPIRLAGQVIGSTTPDGGYADQRPVHYKELTATLYHNLGINFHQRPLPGPGDRPVYLLDEYKPVEELVG